MAAEPVFACVYAPSGFGKTVDVGYAFPNAVYYAKKGATKSIVSVCGYEPAVLPHSTLDAVTRDMPTIAKSGKYDAIVVDEFDFLAEDTMSALEKKFTGFKLFGALRQSVLNFRNTARDCGLHVVLTALERGPKLRDDGTKVRGGPALTGDLPEKVPAMCDLVLRGSRDPLRKPWPGIYRVDINSADWISKDRDNSTPDPAPMNLGEILRCHYNISRHKSVPQQEEAVEHIARTILGGQPMEDTKVVTESYTSLLSAGMPPAFARWTVRDAWDRALLRRSKAIREANFF